MNAVRRALAFAMLVALLIAAETPKTEIDPAKLVGAWSFVKANEHMPIDPGTQFKLEFMKDGKVQLAVKREDGKFDTSGTYKIKGDQLTWTMKTPSGKERTETHTIAKLTDKLLILSKKIDVQVIGKKPTTVVGTMEFKK